MAYVVSREVAREGGQGGPAAGGHRGDDAAVARRARQPSSTRPSARPRTRDLFFLYEQYVDEAGYEAHMDSEHFTRLVKEEAIPDLLEAREREFYETIGDERGRARRFMKLDERVHRPRPVDEAWAVLLDVERVAPCLPGAALDGGDGDEFNGTMKIKIGPVTSRYKGTVRIERGRRARAPRGAARRRRATPRPAAPRRRRSRRRCEPVERRHARRRSRPTCASPGPAAQFGRGVMQDVSGKLMRQFADCLAEEMGDGDAARGRRRVRTDGARAPRRSGGRRRAAASTTRRPPSGRLPDGPGRRRRARPPPHAGRRRASPRRRGRPTSSTWAPRRAAPCSSGLVPVALAAAAPRSPPSSSGGGGAA